MKKEEIRREFFKLRQQGFPYTKCQRLLLGQLEYRISTRTLKRWSARLDRGGWDLCDISSRPIRVMQKVTPEVISKVVSLRKKTGWGQDKIKATLPELGISATTIKRIIGQEGLARSTKLRGKRVKWVRWQRHHPNSLWQMDHTDEQDKKNCYTLSIIDDCSRYSLALVKLNSVTTNVVTSILDRLITAHGTPREILTDNGSAYGGKSQHSRFDRWCKKKGIRHIRSKIHSPTTCGKVERLFKTMDEEMEFCDEDSEVFRMRYNHHRSHGSLSGQVPARIYFGQ
jgi:transposase InsO family protein